MSNIFSQGRSEAFLNFIKSALRRIKTSPACFHRLFWKELRIKDSGVASPKIWGQKLWGGNMFDFRRITLFCLENASQSTKCQCFLKIWGAWPLWPPPLATPMIKDLVLFGFSKEKLVGTLPLLLNMGFHNKTVCKISWNIVLGKVLLTSRCKRCRNYALQFHWYTPEITTEQNRRQKVLNRGALCFCGGALGLCGGA